MIRYVIESDDPLRFPVGPDACRSWAGAVL